MSATRRLVASAYKSRNNRVYYEECFRSANLSKNGILQVEQKSQYDRVILDESKNEFLRFYGFGQNGSHFDLSLSILSLYPQADDDVESKWRLANIEFTYIDLSDNCRYSYKTKQLIDYSEKKADSHESRNIYKIGSLSIEIVAPFSLSRIVFNGYLEKSSLDVADRSTHLVSSKLTISTHPSCDKYDYQYRFDPEYISKSIRAASGNAKSSPDETRRLLGLALDDRIDTPLMYQVHLDSCIDGANSMPNNSSSVVMWGAKVRRFINSTESIHLPVEKAEEPMDDLFIWSKVGHQVHLSRPLNHKRLVNGMVSSSVDYANYLLDCKLISSTTTDITPTTVAGEQHQEQQQQQQVEGTTFDFNELESFANLMPGMKIYLRAFTSKEYKISINANKSSAEGFIELDINGYEGWAICRTHNAIQSLRQAQSTLWALDIHDRKFAHRLASESLLGGKGNSLVDLNSFVSDWTGKIFLQEDRNLSPGEVSIPRGVVVSCVAYQMWLKSNPLIGKSIEELDNTRRAMSARSVCTNPLSDKYMPLAQSQQILREQCKKTCSVLNLCPLPQVLVKQLRVILYKIFTDEELKNPPTSDTDEDEGRYKRFAVRSSAVGEDSLETSAAGQMRTILDAKGFDSIVRSIVDCWSSQFEPEAVMYKTQNGLEFNLPMAVVVQELILCKAAGVATTCDPLTGAKSTLQILANLGLGEGVVSGNKTDTIRVSLESLGWNQETEEHVGHFSRSNLSSQEAHRRLYKVTSDSGGGDADADGSCCLSGEQIFALGNLLIWLRRKSDIRDREVEWGITMDEQQQTDSSSSSSSGSSAVERASQKFHIHLLQSRPLTHLFKLNSREIDHELDSGFASPINVVSRANLGEVMPGALCPLTCTYFMPIVTNFRDGKPFEHQHTHKPFSASSFAFHAQVACLVLSYTDTLVRFGQSADKDDQESQDRAIMFRAMIGTTDNPNPDIEARVKLTKERVNPNSKIEPGRLANLIALDSGLYNVFYYRARKMLRATKFETDLTSIENYIDQLESGNGNASASNRLNSISTAMATNTNESVFENIERDIGRLFGRLTKSTSLLGLAWKTHIRATMLSMALNGICIKLLSQQSAYPESLSSTEILNDFSTLMQGGEKTESGNISSLLDELIQTIIDEGKFEQASKMSAKELYDYLTNSTQKRSSVLFNEFLKKNGHRSFKEFDFSTLTWADDPSYITKSLSTRLKLHKPEQVEKERQSARKRNQAGDKERNDILENKVQNGRAILNGYLLPRCRNGAVRREGSKSLVIETISKYRKAFRHLGGLLCLAGRLPSVDLIFQLTIEELELFVNSRENNNRSVDLSRILYKCRRRQQRARVLNQITYPRPVLEFSEMIELTKQVTGELPPQSVEGLNVPDIVRVGGLTSCAGYVTGRACVVQSLDDMDQIQPNDILITYSIDISWSVYFFTLAGIVTEVGGIVSHGAVVAREYGIPTLCTAIGACSIFKTGQMVTLDANRAICYLASDSLKSSSLSAPIGESAISKLLANGDDRQQPEQH